MSDREISSPSSHADAAAHRARPFKVVCVEKTEMPDGGDGRNWYRYELHNGRSTIVGQRRGSLKDVSAYAARYAEQLNSRSNGAHSIWSPRNKKQA
ncbi:MAG TPA: hypothetical protein VGA00_13665 [Acidiferrobacterales bacterium]|jgi:hypothetical protein